MERHERVSAITQSLPGLESFLRDVLANETLSSEADKQRQEFIRRLDILSQPPSLPPRPKHIALSRKRSQNHYDRRGKIHLHNLLNSSGSPAPAQSQIENREVSPYKNDANVDPVEFASKQRELARNKTLYKSYVTRQDILSDRGNRGDKFEGTILEDLHGSTSHRLSIKSSSSCEDDIYEHLSSTTPLHSPLDKEAAQKGIEPFVFGSPPNGGGETPVSVGSRGTSVRGSGSKGKLIYATGWFKKEAKVYEEVFPSSLKDPTIQGWLKDIKSNKRRLCVIKDHRFYIFKNQEEPAMQILNLPDCDIAVDDKKKISYSFRLTPHGGTPVTLAIEEGYDLSPWMSTIMAAVVRKSTCRPTSPIEGALDLEEARHRAMSPPYQGNETTTSTDGTQTNADPETPYELPVDFGYDNWLLRSSVDAPTPVHSTPTGRREGEVEDEPDQYDAPLPPIPTDAVDGGSSSSESSSDEDEDEKRDKRSGKDLSKKMNSKLRKRKDHDEKMDLSQNPRIELRENKRDSFYDTQSEHSGGCASNWQSCSEPLASDDTGSSDQRLLDVPPCPVARSDSVSSRKRTSTVLSTVSIESLGSDLDITTAPESLPDKKVNKILRPPKEKKRRKLTSAESLKQFLQDASAAHSGKLYQKRRLAVWTKRYCKIIDNCLKCYRHPDDEKPCIDFPLLGYDITLIDSKESKKGYAFKISHPNMEALYFATDSRNSVERWIEMLSLAATGQLENAAPYLPYFSSGADASISQSRDSLVSSEDAPEGDSLDDIDNSSGSPQLLPKHHGPYNDASGFAATDELEDDASSDARDNHQLKSRNRHKQRSQLSSTDSHASDNALKRHRETNSTREIHSESDTPGTMSPPHSVFIADPPDAVNRDSVPPEDKSREEQKKEKEKKGWADALKLKRGTLGRRSSLEQLKDRASATDLQTFAKYKSNTIKKSGHSFAHLLTLFDREGKFSGFLTEIKTGKFSTTHLRRWCVVRNGVLHLYKSEMEDSPVSKLSLVEMYVTEEIDEEKRKFSFRLHDKEEKIHAFQSNSKEDFQKWMGVLNLFTDLRGSPDKNQRIHAVLKKLDSGSCSDEGNFERSTVQSKSARYSYEKEKKDDLAHSPLGKRQSLKTKLSQRRVNVRDIFRRSHSSYDMADALHNEDNAALSSDVNTVNYTGGVLTEMNVSEDSYVRNTKRWCTVKGKILLVYTDHKASDPIRQIPLEHAWICDNSDPGHKLFRFRITLKNEQFSFLTTDQADLNRWLKNLEEAVSGPSEEEPTTRCMVRIPSPGIKKMHRRTQSETFAQKMSEADPSSRRLAPPRLKEEKWTSCSSFRTSSSSFQLTDKLVASYLQEMHEKSGAVTLLRRWCVATSEKFLVYYNEESDKPLKSWDMASLRIVDDSSNPSTDLFGFCVHHDGKVNSFQNVDHDVIKQWLSVLSRYCHPSKEQDSPINQLPRQRYKKSASEHDIKADHDNRKLFRVFSEGRASGAKLLRKVSDDGLFLRKFNRPELLRTSFKSPEKPEVKLRDKSSLSSYDAERRFSCGSLFDSDGKFSSFLMELNANDKCRSQVKRWCVLRDDYMLVYEFEGASEPRKVIPLENAKLTKEVDYENGIYLLNILYSGDEQANFRAISRTDLEKWTTVISVKNAVIRSRSERDLRRQSREFTPQITTKAPSTTDLRLHSEASYSPEPERNYLCPRGNPSSGTSGEGSDWRLKSCSLSSFAPSEDSVFTADSRMDEIGIGVGLGPTRWKIQPSVDSSEGSTDEETSSNSGKGLYTGESLKDFFELVMSPSDQITRDLGKINLVDQLDQIPRDGTRTQLSSSNDIRAKTNSSETGSCENTGKGRQVSKGLKLNLPNSSTKVDSLSPSREIIGFEKINFRERSGSDTSTQDTYFGPPTPNRNSLERGSMRPEEFVECDKDVVAQWLEDLVDDVTQERYFENPKNQSIEYRERDRLFECSFKDESRLESTTFEPGREPIFSVSEKNWPKTNRDGSVGCFLEELVSSVAQDFAKTMSFGVESPEGENVKELSELAGGVVVGSLEYRNSPITCPEVVVIKPAAETEAQAQGNLPGSTGVVEAPGDENLNEPKTGVNSALDVNSELLKTEQEMQVVLVSSTSGDSDKDCETVVTTYHGTDSELMATERTAVDEHKVKLDPSSNSSSISLCVVGDQTSLAEKGILEAHTEAHINSSEDLHRSVENDEINAEVEASLLLNRSESDQDLPVEPSKLAICESGTTSKSEEGISVDALRINSTYELPSTHSTEREVHQMEKDESLLGEGSGSKTTLPKAETEVTEVATQAQDEDVPNVIYEAGVTSESEKLSCIPLSDVTPDTEAGKQKYEDRQTPPQCTDSTHRTQTRAELTRSQADCINAVSEAFQGIVDIVADSDTKMEETKL